MTKKYTIEADFEKDVIAKLNACGWKGGSNYPFVLKYPSEADLIKNWANIIFEHNRKELNNVPLNQDEIDNLLLKIRGKTPCEINRIINSKLIDLIRSNKTDTENYNKTVYLEIYDRKKIQDGETVFQIAEQPIFERKTSMDHDRRGDLMLLINGMPLYHLELKKSDVPWEAAFNQLRLYHSEGIYSGFFSFVQVFVAMTPEETRYFAHPGEYTKFNKGFAFKWAKERNVEVLEWEEFIHKFLYIPMAHEIIGFYTVPDKTDDSLKVLRSYQFNAVRSIRNKVSSHKDKWTDGIQTGGYIWNTTGSGKTMTSFKTAQIISEEGLCDKVVFLLDRIELGSQTLTEYKNFSDDTMDVQDTANTGKLWQRLLSDNNTPGVNTKLIVTSIQKMSNLVPNEKNKKDFEKINKKKIVIIIDEAHRDTFGTMLSVIKNSFPNALFFGFTGTPIFEENKKIIYSKDDSGSAEFTTADVFGDEFKDATYTIANGIHDGNVLGFDPCMKLLNNDNEVRKAAGYRACGTNDEEKIYTDESLTKCFQAYLNDKTMIEIEKEIPNSNYSGDTKEADEYRNAVVHDIVKNWNNVTVGGKFHGIFATSSIEQAFEYYKIFKEKAPKLKVTVLVDPSTDGAYGAEKEIALKEIIADYNANFYKTEKFTLETYDQMKTNVSWRLAHKETFKNLKKEQYLNLLIVVNQMLTGFDSKYVNVLYLDKILDYENLIQAMSRTNRIYGNEKRHGIIHFYRKPHIMKKNVEDAVRTYSGENTQGVFVNKLPSNLKKMEETYSEIQNLFVKAGIPDCSKLPEDEATVAKFVKLYNRFNAYLDAAKVQGFNWDKNTYYVEESEVGKPEVTPTPAGDETTATIKESVSFSVQKNGFDTITQRYIEVGKGGPGPGPGPHVVPPFELDIHLVENHMDKIDEAYLQKFFKAYIDSMKATGEGSEESKKALEELYSEFAKLSADHQRIAKNIISDIQTGKLNVDDEFSLGDLITKYAKDEQDNKTKEFCDNLGMDVSKFNQIANGINKDNPDEGGKLSDLIKLADPEKAKAYFLQRDKVEYPGWKCKFHSLRATCTVI
ncbi:type I restriction endonuclease subunit R, EcoR124 family [Treponema sp.]|uniref:type I restriction endonuclease subunit R, EcoR124 family n=1 Tax=Treponema sp. TaxID=166 RepID=UPI00298DF256|nr:HsdR family type I site-specific deoxyribonuclease [Treponema sp.]